MDFNLGKETRSVPKYVKKRKGVVVASKKPNLFQLRVNVKYLIEDPLINPTNPYTDAGIEDGIAHLAIFKLVGVIAIDLLSKRAES